MPMVDPNYVPEELKTPFDILELPSQGFLYPNKIVYLNLIIRAFC